MPKKVKDGKLVLTHGQLKKQIVDYLRWHKWLVIPINQGPFSYDGIADLYISKRRGWENYIVWVELKTGKDKQSKYQRQFELDVCGYGARYWLIHSLEELQHLLWFYNFAGGKE